jgi:hypothetical protein
MQSRMEEGRKNLIDANALQLQKKILEEVELHLENIQVRYNSSISKARVIKDKEKKIEDSIVFGKKIDVMGV